MTRNEWNKLKPTLELVCYPNENYAYYDYNTETLYNESGRELSNPDPYEGYTPFGDE